MQKTPSALNELPTDLRELLGQVIMPHLWFSEVRAARPRWKEMLE